MKRAPANVDVRPISNSPPPPPPYQTRFIYLFAGLGGRLRGPSHAYMCVCALLTLIHNKPDSSSSDLEDASTAMPLGTPHRKCLAPSAMISQEVSRSHGDLTGSAEVHL